MSSIYEFFNSVIVIRKFTFKYWILKLNCGSLLVVLLKACVVTILHAYIHIHIKIYFTMGNSFRHNYPPFNPGRWELDALDPGSEMHALANCFLLFWQFTFVCSYLQFFRLLLVYCLFFGFLLQLIYSGTDVGYYFLQGVMLAAASLHRSFVHLNDFQDVQNKE